MRLGRPLFRNVGKVRAVALALFPENTRESNAKNVFIVHRR